FATGFLFSHQQQPPFPRNGLFSSSNMVPQWNPFSTSYIARQFCHGTNAMARGIPDNESRSLWSSQQGLRRLPVLSARGGQQPPVRE
ncbi:MAG: hypothetical protein PUC12_05930, partial [Clostridiales bacterium]|nr:hypothetical protein [Clostridiales bacterium]